MLPLEDDGLTGDDIILVPWLRRWLIFTLTWNSIVLSRSIPNYFCSVRLYGSGGNLIAPILGRIPLYRHFYMLLLCGLVIVFDLSLYVIDINTMIRRLLNIRLSMRVLLNICLDHLEAMSLSALN